RGSASKAKSNRRCPLSWAVRPPRAPSANRPADDQRPSGCDGVAFTGSAPSGVCACAYAAVNTTASRTKPEIRRDGSAVAHLLLSRAPRSVNMLETIAIILIILWLLGIVSGYTLGNFIYVLLVIAIVLFLVRLISGRTV